MTVSTHARQGRRLAVATVLLVVLASGQAPAQAASTLALTSTPTYQTNGRVAAVLTVGTTTYLAGAFTSVRPAGAPRGTGEVRRKFLAAVDSVTGALRAWNPRADAAVFALAASPDGSTIYAGGSFGTVGGVVRKHVAALSTAGAVTSFRADTDLSVHALATSGARVYLGGSFTQVNGQSRAHLAAVDASGNVDAGWAPVADDTVHAIALAADVTSVWVGGDFTSVNGAAATSNLAKLSVSNGAAQSLASRPGWPVHAIVTTSTRVFVGGDGDGGHAAAYNTTGALQWLRQTDGGVQAVVLVDNVLYLGGHYDNMCLGDHPKIGTLGFVCPQIDAVRHKLMAVDASTGATDPWNPGANSPLGVFALDNVGGRLHVGGEFTKIGHRDQQGYSQFG
jgi:hypothetical protein